MRSITEIVKQFKQNWTEELNSQNIAEACRDSGMTWIESMLNPVVTIQIFFLQILNGNTACTDMPSGSNGFYGGRILQGTNANQVRCLSASSAEMRSLNQIVAWLKNPKSKPRWMTAEQFASLPDEITVRELRYDVHQKGFRAKKITLVTTLLDEEIYSLPEIAELYRRRWEIETNFGHVKTTMKMDVLKCKTVDGVLKELHVFALIYNLVRQVMVEAALRQNVPNTRISFIDALRWLQSAQPGDELSKLVVIPDRPDRYEPRVRKRRPKQYKLMNKPRWQLKQELAQQ